MKTKQVWRVFNLQMLTRKASTRPFAVKVERTGLLALTIMMMMMMTIMMMTMSMMMMMMNISRHCWESRENQFVGRRKFSCSGTAPLFVELLALTHYLSSQFQPVFLNFSLFKSISSSLCTVLLLHRLASDFQPILLRRLVVFHQILDNFCSPKLLSISFCSIFAHPSKFVCSSASELPDFLS